MISSTSLYIGIDIGTSGVRACAINNKKKILHSCSTTLPPPIKNGRSITQDAELWWLATQNVLRDLFKQIDAQSVEAICINGTSGTVLACDKQGVPLAPARMYNDAFCSDQAAQIKNLAPPQSAAHGSTSGLAKLLYLQQQFPQTRHFLHQADWVAGKLCGRFDISDENNALKSGYNPQTACWPDWLKQLNIDISLLPHVQAPGTPIASVLDVSFGLNSDCQIISGTTDSIAAFIATGASQPGDAVTSLGSTLVLKIISEQPIFSAEFGIYSHKLGHYWLAGGASNSGGAVLAHYFNPQQIDDLSTVLKPDIPTHLNYYPLLQTGERFPVNDANMKPRLKPEAASDIKFFQGILEGISQIELDGYHKLQQLGAPFPSQVETAGGGSKNKGWLQIRQKALNVSVKRAEFSEACYGSALLARQGIVGEIKTEC